MCAGCQWRRRGALRPWDRRGGAGGTFAIEYGDSTGGERLEEISRNGVETIHYNPAVDHPPAIVFCAHDGHRVCGFGMSEERIRWGEEHDLLLPDLVAAGILHPDSDTYCAPDPEDYAVRDRRTPAVVEARFGLSLPPVVLTEARLPAYAVRGTPDMTTQDPDFDIIHAWATRNGHPLPSSGLRRVPNSRDWPPARNEPMSH
jgi:hypothetical protein